MTENINVIPSLNQAMTVQPPATGQAVAGQQIQQVVQPTVPVSTQQPVDVSQQTISGNQPQQPFVDAQTYLGQLPNAGQQVRVPQQLDTQQVAVMPQQDALSLPETVVSAEPVKKSFKNKVESFIEFVKSDKCAISTGVVLSTIALVAYALSPKRAPQPGILQRIKNFFS